MCLVSFVMINVKHNDAFTRSPKVGVRAWLRRQFSSQHGRSDFFTLPDGNTSEVDNQTRQPPPYLAQRRDPEIITQLFEGDNRRAIDQDPEVHHGTS
jgi:hypothetical protein